MKPEVTPGEKEQQFTPTAVQKAMFTALAASIEERIREYAPDEQGREILRRYAAGLILDGTAADKAEKVRPNPPVDHEELRKALLPLREGSGVSLRLGPDGEIVSTPLSSDEV